MPIPEPRIAYVAFQECEIRGKWEDKIDDAMDHGADPVDDGFALESSNVEPYHAKDDHCELWVVRPDGLRKAWLFKYGAMVTIRGNTVKFYQGMVAEELSVNEEEQMRR